jgi:alkylated DNA repair dioxygenase AlkB
MLAHDSGDGRYRYIPGFLPASQASLLLDTLTATVAWRAEQVRMFGRRIPVPRLVAWCGDTGINYRYSSLDHPCSGWIPALEPVRQRLRLVHGFDSAMALLNRYRNGDDGMGWHTDDEPGQGAWVASISLGAPRRFLLRPDPGGASLALVLEHGSLLLMPAAMPHALPKTRRPIGERINLSLRPYPAPADCPVRAR